jgi:hypothetical protein
MKFGQILAAVAIFKAYDGAFALAYLAGSNAPLVTFAIAIVIWLVVSLFIWATLSHIDLRFGLARTTND